MDSLSQYSEAQLAKYLHRIGDGDLDTFLSKVSLEYWTGS